MPSAAGLQQLFVSLGRVFLCCSTARVAGQVPHISAPTISFQPLCRASFKCSFSNTPESLSVCVLKTEVFINYMNFTHPQQWKSYWKTPKGFGVCSYRCKRANGKRATKPVTVLSSFPLIHRYHKISLLTGRPCTVSLPDVVLLWSMFSSQLPSTSRCFSSCYSL